MQSVPVILCFGGHDPTGGAGITADTQTAAALGVHAATVITALTVQDTRGVNGVQAVAPERVLAQAHAVLADLNIVAIKTGLLPNAEIVDAVAGLAAEYHSLPLVVDPILAPGGKGELLTGDIAAALREHLLPHAELATPNTLELGSIAGIDDPKQAIAIWRQTGCSHILVTGTHAATGPVQHQLFAATGDATCFEQARLPHEYHGSGCTLATACAAGLANGLSVNDAATAALRYTETALRRGFAPGHGQWLPNRINTPDQ